MNYFRKTITTTFIYAGIIFLLTIVFFQLTANALFADEERVKLNDQLIIESTGPARFFLTTPYGERVGSRGLEYDFTSSEITDYRLGVDYQAVRIETPNEGHYELTFNTHIEDDTYILLTITWLGAQKSHDNYYELPLIVSEEGQTQFSFALQRGQDEPIILGRNLSKAPENLYLRKKSEDHVLLQWDSVDEAQEYVVYKKQDNVDTDLKLVSNLQESNIEIPLVWGPRVLTPAVISQYTEFKVASVFSDNSVSVLSESVFSNDRDGDGLSDDQELALGTNPLVADSDNDGLPDFNEVNIHHSNPLVRDSDGDGFDDGYEYSLGSHMLDVESTPVEICTPQEGDWYVNDDCSLDDDTYINSNIILNNNIILTLKEGITLWLEDFQSTIFINKNAQIIFEEGSSIRLH